MASKGSVKSNGAFSGMDLKNFDAAEESLLEAIGAKGVEVMRKVMLSKLPHGDATGETRKSVMWRTSATYVPPEHEDESEIIDRPPQHGVWIGSAYPNANFMEYGTAAHVNNTDTEEFIQAIRDWMEIRGIDEKYLWPIVKTIRAHGTEQRPYAQETLNKMSNYAQKMAEKWIQKYLTGKGNAVIEGSFTPTRDYKDDL